MNDTTARRCLERFRAYAAAFETAYATNDWRVLEPHFTVEATSELNGNLVAGRDAVIASLRDGVAMFDRRFDSRTHRIIEGPEIQDGRVHIKTSGLYERAGIEPLELIGEEWFDFDGDRIARHVDNVVNFMEVMTYLGNHAGDLLPMVPYA
jgi:hypothetical protein